MSSYDFTAKNKQTGEQLVVSAMDDYFGKHRYGYKTGNRILTEEEFDLAYERID